MRKIVTEEKNTTNLVSLPDNFFKDVKVYLTRKTELSVDKEDKWELESARRLLQDLFEIRERKILNLALYYVRSGVMPENMVHEEREFFNIVVSQIKDFQAKRKEMFEKEVVKKDVVAILDILPEFVGSDLKNYGPFKQGDIVTLPKDNANLLIEKGVAKRIEVK
jgi:DNA replication factor GINS